MQTGNLHAAAIIEPYNDPASVRTDCGMLGAGHTVALAAAHDDKKRLKGACFQALTYVSDHTCALCYRDGKSGGKRSGM
jgi:hypothetical protein